MILGALAFAFVVFVAAYVTYALRPPTHTPASTRPGQSAGGSDSDASAGAASPPVRRIRHAAAHAATAAPRVRSHAESGYIAPRRGAPMKLWNVTREDE